MDHSIGSGIIPNGAQEMAERFRRFIILVKKLINALVLGENVAANLSVEILNVKPDDGHWLEGRSNYDVIIDQQILVSGVIPVVGKLTAILHLHNRGLDGVDVPSGILGLALLVLGSDVIVKLGGRNIPNKHRHLPLIGRHLSVLGPVNTLNIHRLVTRSIGLGPLDNTRAKIHEVLGELHKLRPVIGAPILVELIKSLRKRHAPAVGIRGI